MATCAATWLLQRWKGSRCEPLHFSKGPRGALPELTKQNDLAMNYTTLTTTEIAALAEAKREEMGACGLTAGDVLDALESGRAVLEVRPYGFGIVTLKPGLDGKQMPHLWLLYVDAANRGQRLGNRFVRFLLRRYAKDYHMTVSCYGPRRRAFFGRLGFRVESRDGELRQMTTSDHR